MLYRSCSNVAMIYLKRMPPPCPAPCQPYTLSLLPVFPGMVQEEVPCQLPCCLRQAPQTASWMCQLCFRGNADNSPCPGFLLSIISGGQMGGKSLLLELMRTDQKSKHAKGLVNFSQVHVNQTSQNWAKECWFCCSSIFSLENVPLCAWMLRL